MDNRNTERKSTEFMLIPENDRAQVNFFRKNVTTDLSSDFTLPDYMPEIRKMLGVSAKLSPISRYIGGNGIEFSGRVDYDLIYTGGDGKLASAPLGTDFSFEVQPEVPPHIDWNSSNDAFADIETDMLHCRVTAPRKVNIKCRLHSLVRAYGYDEINDDIRDRNSGTERLISEVKCSELHRRMSEVIELGDEIPLDTASENIRPILSRGSVNISDVSESGNRLNCRGEVITDIIYENTETNQTDSVTRKIPFTQEIDIGDEQNDTANTSAAHNVRGICGEVRVNIGDGKLLLDTEVILESDTAENIPVSVTQDIFMPGKECKADYRDFRFETVEKCANGIMNLTESIPLSDFSMSGESEIIYCFGTVRTEGISQDDGRISINGSYKIRIISKNGEEYSSGELSLPYSFESGIAAADAPLSLIAKPIITDCRCRIEGENVICETEIMLPYCLLSEHVIRIVNCMECGDERMAADSGINVYYPASGETLWSVAKRFSAPLRSIAEANDLPSAKGNEDISSRHYILIY